VMRFFALVCMGLLAFISLVESPFPSSRLYIIVACDVGIGLIAAILALREP
jgi:hypothetical protein